ncbi:MAG: transporter [Calditrichaeota bacterium]|nr:MAG: transporter [Calditrichota bacterium]MBL1206604.1 transporter [Calditrichota bacterium]NOG46431.1 transporter [Calditrichota bacterium]
MRITIYISLILILNLVHAQATELVTDRPDQTESAVVVPKNSLQVESGLLYQNEDPAESYEIAGTLFRFGLFQEAELRIGSSYNLNRFNSNNDFEKTIALQLGTKIHLFEETANMPEMALIAQVSFPPFGNDSDEKAEPGFLMALEKSLSDRFSLGINAGGDFVDGSGFNFKYSVAAGVDLTETFGSYLEIYGSKPQDTDLNILFDGGITWMAAPLSQIDLSVGKSLNSDIESWYFNIGISSLFQNIF